MAAARPRRAFVGDPALRRVFRRTRAFSQAVADAELAAKRDAKKRDRALAKKQAKEARAAKRAAKREAPVVVEAPPAEPSLLDSVGGFFRSLSFGVTASA